MVFGKARCEMNNQSEIEREAERLWRLGGFNSQAKAQAESDATETLRLKAENDTLRRLMPALNAPCVYCGLIDISKCKSGFPGCAQADDLMVGDNEVMKRLLEDNRKLKAELEQARAANWEFRNHIAELVSHSPARSDPVENSIVERLNELKQLRSQIEIQKQLLDSEKVIVVGDELVLEENKQLREEVKVLRDSSSLAEVTEAIKQLRDQDVQIKELREENARLREASQQALDWLSSRNFTPRTQRALQEALHPKGEK